MRVQREMQVVFHDACNILTKQAPSRQNVGSTFYVPISTKLIFAAHVSHFMHIDVVNIDVLY